MTVLIRKDPFEGEEYTLQESLDYKRIITALAEKIREVDSKLADEVIAEGKRALAQGDHYVKTVRGYSWISIGEAFEWVKTKSGDTYWYTLDQGAIGGIKVNVREVLGEQQS